jgi:hypothetical protein
MKTFLPQINLVAAWMGILAGFVSGMVLGLFFHRDDWLGGYGSFKRRMYRLGHISLFGLGAMNLFFYLTTRTLAAGPMLAVAGWGFLSGAVTMPACCVVMAYFRKAQALFAVPVLSLIAGAVLTLASILQPANWKALTTVWSAGSGQSAQPTLHWTGELPPPGPWTLNLL